MRFKKFLLPALVFCLFAHVSTAQAIKDTLSYSFGLQIARSMNDGDILKLIDINSFVKAFEDVRANTTKLTSEESEEFLRNYFTSMQERELNQNKIKGQAFLDENAKKPGVVTLPSTLQYKIVNQGTGAKPTETDNVEVHYKGTLINGETFDSSYDRGETITFRLNSVIPGWIEGLQYVGEGGKIILYIPSSLAYGDYAMPGSPIPAGSALIFEIELFKILPASENEEAELEVIAIEE